MSHVWHVFVIRCKHRDDLQHYLSENYIQTIIHYPIPPHKQPAYKEWNQIQLPLTEGIHKQVLSLPIGPDMNKEEIRQVVETINRFNQDTE
jgi:dTDP-4-amino-4,6-dideoxygalactose transaminase